MKSIGTVARWATALVTAGALLAVSGGIAQADPVPVSGTEGLVKIGSSFLPPGTPLVSPDGRRAYTIANDTDNHTRVRVVNTVADRVVATIDLGMEKWTRYRPALSADGRRLYVLNGLTLSVIDTGRDRVLNSLDLPDEPRPTGWGPGVAGTIAVNGPLVYVTQDGPAPGTSVPTAGLVWVYDTARRAVTGSVQLPGGDPRSIAVRPDGRSAYVSTETGIVHLDTTGAVPTVLGTVPGTANAQVDGLALTPDGSSLYAVNAVGDGTAIRVDLNHDTVTAHLTLTKGYSQLASPLVSADGTRLFVANSYPSGAPSVLAFDTATGAEVPNEDVFGFDVDDLVGLAIGPDGQTMYGTGGDSNGAELQIFDF
ncbi:beta-propeller fold lactonase family protein [Kitasatospora mediocidica]|uniref:hypothetical protein n=1 Tax=Kitasatospora mediocidica TaxID=58352 RepID=UPI00055DAB99|nr:hypothetical protein [Kitasatospora mediocidica]